MSWGENDELIATAEQLKAAPAPSWGADDEVIATAQELNGGDWRTNAAQKFRDLAARTQPQSDEWWAARRQESALADADPMAAAPAIIREPYYGVAGAAAGIASTVARPFSKDAADYLAEQGQQVEAQQAAARKDDWSPWLSRMYGGAAQSLAQAAVAAPLGSAGIIGSFALTEGNQALYDAEQAGLKGMDRIKYAVIQGGIEGAIAGAFQLAGLGGQEKFIADAVKGALKLSGKQFLKMTAQELPEELLTELHHAGVEAAYGVNPQAMTSKEFWPRMRDTVVQTLMTLGLAQATTAVSQLRQKANDIDVMTGKGFVTKQEAEKIGLTPEQAKNRESRKKAVEERKQQLQRDVKELEKQVPPVDKSPSEGDVFKSPGGGTFVFSNGAWTPQISKEPSDASTVRGVEAEVPRGQVEGGAGVRGDGEEQVPAEPAGEGVTAPEVPVAEPSPDVRELMRRAEEAAPEAAQEPASPIDSLAREIADREIPLTAKQIRQQAQRKGLNPTAVLTAVRKLRSQPLTGEALEEQRRRSAEGVRQSERQRQREEKRQERFAADVEKIHDAMLAAGWKLDKISESGSRYYSRGDELARVSDHAANPATQAWIDKNGVTEISRLEDVHSKPHASPQKPSPKEQGKKPVPPAETLPEATGKPEKATKIGNIDVKHVEAAFPGATIAVPTDGQGWDVHLRTGDKVQIRFRDKTVFTPEQHARAEKRYWEKFAKDTEYYGRFQFVTRGGEGIPTVSLIELNSRLATPEHLKHEDFHRLVKMAPQSVVDALAKKYAPGVKKSQREEAIVRRLTEDAESRGGFVAKMREFISQLLRSVGLGDMSEADALRWIDSMKAEEGTLPGAAGKPEKPKKRQVRKPAVPAESVPQGIVSGGMKKPKAESASETAQREAEEERPDIASAVAEELAKRQEQAQAKKKRSERAAERQAEALSELDDALKRLGKPGKLTSFPAIDTDKLKAAVDATLAAGKYGIASFDKFISTVVERMGERFVRDHAPYLEEAARQTGMTGVTSVDDVLEAIQKTASEEPSGETTGTKNAKTDELRSEAGMEERPPVDAETFQQWEDEAAQRIADDKNYAPSLAEELANNPRPITDVENAALGQYINDLNNRRKAGEDVFEELATAIVASERGGTETGRALASRRGERYADGSLAGFVSQYVASVNETPSTEQMQRFAEMADKIAKLEGEVKETQQKLAQAELDLRIAEAKAAKTKPAQEKRGTKRAVLQKKAADAVEAFKKEWASLGQLGIVSDPKQEADKWIAATKAAGNVVKAYAELGVDSFLELLSNLGQLTANQRKAFREAWTEYRSGMEPVEVPDLSAIGTVARRLTRFAVEAGITEREAVVDAVHQELTDMGFEVDRSGTMAAMSGYGVFRELSKDEVSVKIRAINGELQQILKLEDMQNNRAPKKTGVERREPTDAERRLIKLVNEAKKRGGYVVTDPAKQLKSALGAAKTAARNRIADLQNAIAKRERIVSGQTKLIPDAELADLQKQRDELNKEYQQIFGKSGMSEAAKLKAAEKMLDRRIDELKADLAAGNMEGKPKKSPLTSPEIEAKKLQLEQLKSIREQARLADPAYQAKEAAKQTARYKKSLEQRLKIWEQRRDDAANGILPPKRKPSPIDKEILEKKFQIEQVKRHAQAEIDEAARAKQGKSGKALGFGGDLLDLSQAIMTGYEMSAVLRQGAFYTFGFPKQSSKAIKNAVRAFFSRRADFSIHDDLMSRPNHVDYMRGGLETTAADGPLSHREELIRSRIASWLASKPGAAWALPRWAAEGLLGSERSFRAFANTMRADLFDYMKASIEAARPGTWSEDDAKVIGNASNVFSGRGKLPPSMTGVASSRIFFAPRWVWSRGQLLVGQPLWRGDSKTRLAVGKVYVRAAVGFAAFALLRHYLYAMLAGGDDEEPEYELDPRSSDFGKMRIGDTRIDSGAGLNQLIVLLARLSTGETKQASGKIVPIRGDDVPYGSGDTFEIGARFLRSKLAPLPSGVLDWIVGKNVAGKKVTTGSIIAERTSPMTWRDIWAAEKALNVPQGTVAAIEAFFGEGVTTYGQKTTYRNADEAGRQEIIKKDLKYLQWDSPEKPAYAEFLTPDQLQKFSERRNEKRQQVILDATHEPGRDSHKNDETFQESLEKRDKNIDYLREMKAEGVTLAEAEQILESYYQTDDPATKKDESKMSSDEKKSLKAKLDKLAEIYGE